MLKLQRKRSLDSSQTNFQNYPLASSAHGRGLSLALCVCLQFCMMGCEYFSCGVVSESICVISLWSEAASPGLKSEGTLNVDDSDFSPLPATSQCRDPPLPLLLQLETQPLLECFQRRELTPSEGQSLAEKWQLALKNQYRCNTKKRLGRD